MNTITATKYDTLKQARAGAKRKPFDCVIIGHKDVFLVISKKQLE